MRAAVGILSLLLALAAVGLLTKKQLASTPLAVPAASVRAQSQQVQQAVEGLMQPRAMPDTDQ
ncbi:hypothetical protein [Simplicispira psychrophila]|uniref:hypothetical protein n=1 Tax=Simplicispira psychrophila TaxID=80882 RepID=UPI00047FD79C|nr:hypothetical protein [Simplicispira psychrophila]